MALFCFIFYTLVTVLFLILCIGEHKADAKAVYAAIARSRCRCPVFYWHSIKEDFIMCNTDMLTRARQLVVDYFNKHVDVTDGKQITLDDVFVVWFSKTLQNWKALVSTTVSDGMYYEITHNGDKGETYLDAYKKWDNRCIPD